MLAQARKRELHNYRDTIVDSGALLTSHDSEYSFKNEIKTGAYDMPGHMGVNGSPRQRFGNESLASIVLILEGLSMDIATLERPLR